MKTVFLFLAIISSVNISCKKDFQFVSATSQRWHGGRIESGYGNKYEIKLIPNKSSDKITFDKIWIGEKYFEVKAVQNGRKVKEGIFDAGYEVSIIVNDLIKPKPMQNNKCITKEEQDLINKSKTPVPFSYDGVALLSYTVKGKRKYFEVKEFTKLEEYYYPGKDK